LGECRLACDRALRRLTRLPLYDPPPRVRVIFREQTNHATLLGVPDQQQPRRLNIGFVYSDRGSLQHRLGVSHPSRALDDSC
jgi:hypothetical protein